MQEVFRQIFGLFIGFSLMIFLNYQDYSALMTLLLSVLSYFGCLLLWTETSKKIMMPSYFEDPTPFLINAKKQIETLRILGKHTKDIKRINQNQDIDTTEGLLVLNICDIVDNIIIEIERDSKKFNSIKSLFTQYLPKVYEISLEQDRLRSVPKQSRELLALEKVTDVLKSAESVFALQYRALLEKDDRLLGSNISSLKMLLDVEMKISKETR